MEYTDRKNPRLAYWDYSSTAFYHVVFCTYMHEKLLGLIVESEPEPEMKLSSLGQCVLDAIDFAKAKFPGISVSTQCIMPNHVHMLVELQEGECGSGLGSFVRCVKSSATKLAR